MAGEGDGDVGGPGFGVVDLSEQGVTVPVRLFLVHRFGEVPSTDDLDTLIWWPVQAAEPLEGKANGAGKAACHSFKAHTDGTTDA